MRNLHEVIYAPVITEKGTLVTEAANQVVFKVHPRANKEEIRRAVQSLFGVKVVQVRTANYLGKRRRVGRSVGRRPRWKKAYVTLAPGNTIDFFESV